jgi:poly(3-hydroxyalkanoate) synthetase
MLRWLAARGVRPLLLDWGYPDEAARGFTLTDYIAGRLERALDAADAPRVVLVGYCLGGLLALALALRRPRSVAGLVLLATPWDFHAGEGAATARTLAGMLPLLEPAMASTGMLPTEVLQMLLSLPDLDGVASRFVSFATLDQDSDRARMFVALEDWLSDGVPLAAAVVRECLGGWYGRNTPAQLGWRVAGAVVDPAALRVPTFVAVPGRDRIVPPASALPLATLIPHAVGHYPQAGHIGMAVGASAEAGLWSPMLEWLRSLEG